MNKCDCLKWTFLNTQPASYASFGADFPDYCTFIIALAKVEYNMFNIMQFDKFLRASGDTRSTCDAFFGINNREFVCADVDGIKLARLDTITEA